MVWGICYLSRTNTTPTSLGIGIIRVTHVVSRMVLTDGDRDRQGHADVLDSRKFKTLKSQLAPTLRRLCVSLGSSTLLVMCVALETVSACHFHRKKAKLVWNEWLLMSFGCVVGHVRKHA